MKEVLKGGIHRNPEKREGYFTTAYFHPPEELAGELAQVGFVTVRLFAVEGFAGLVNDDDLAAWLADTGRADRLFSALRRDESEPSMLGATGHLLALGRKP